MKYTAPGTSVKDLLVHLRNNMLAALPRRMTVPCRLVGLAYNAVSRMWELCQQGSELTLVVSERVIENALVFQSLRENDRRILDFGAFESALPLQLAALGYRVTVLDQRSYPFCHPNLTVRSGNVFESNLAIDDHFDVVLSVSTIEHLGLGAYGEAKTEVGADVRGVEVLWGLVRPGGRLLASVPVGKRAVFEDFRVYDRESLGRVFPHATCVRWFMKEGREGTWAEVEEGTTDDLVYSHPTAQFPVEAVAIVISDKAGGPTAPA